MSNDHVPAPAPAAPALENVLGPLGSAVMRVVWEQGEATVGAVTETLNATSMRPHAYTTVMTVMGRLYERGLLSRSKRGRGFVYSAVGAEDELLSSLSGRAVDQLLARYGTAAMRHFAVRLGEIDPDLRLELVKLASRRPKG
jgi:predicted transcriptional regulator